MRNSTRTGSWTVSLPDAALAVIFVVTVSGGGRLVIHVANDRMLIVRVLVPRCCITVDRGDRSIGSGAPGNAAADRHEAGTAECEPPRTDPRRVRSSGYPVARAQSPSTGLVLSATQRAGRSRPKALHLSRPNSPLARPTLEKLARIQQFAKALRQAENGALHLSRFRLNALIYLGLEKGRGGRQQRPDRYISPAEALHLSRKGVASITQKRCISPAKCQFNK